MTPSGSNTGKLYLVDTHGLIFQVFHAIRDMNSPTGLPTNALFGLVRDMLHLRSLRPDYLICALDRAEPTFRTQLYPEYKANRSAMPDDLVLQLPLIDQALQALGIPALSVPGYEADDILATLAVAGAARGLEVYLCSSDKDCRQLIHDQIWLYNLRKRQVFGRDELWEDWGVTPEQVVDLQTLVGDSVDNVPGVPGIGLKTGAKLLQEFGTLDNLLQHLDRVPGKKQESLRAARETLPLSRQLVRLATDVPMLMEWDAWKLRSPEQSQLEELFREWGFYSLINQVRSTRNAGPAVSASSSSSVVTRSSQPTLQQGDLFTSLSTSGSTTATTATTETEGFEDFDELFPFGANARTAEETNSKSDGWNATYHLVDSEEKWTDFLEALRGQRRIALDLETTGLQPLQADIVGMAFCWQGGEAFYLPLRGPSGSALLDYDKTLSQLREVLEDPAVSKVNQNIQFDLLVLRAQGIVLQGVAGDSMVADYLLHAGERTHNLDDLSLRYLGHQVIPITDLIGKKSRKAPQLRMDQVPTSRVAEYAGEDADVAWRLCQLLEAQLAKEGNDSAPQADEPSLPSELVDGGNRDNRDDREAEAEQKEKASQSSLRKLYEELEIPLIEVLAELEFNGIRVNVPLLRQLSIEMDVQLRQIEEEIYKLAGHPFNIGSLTQLRTVLFDELKLPVQARTGVTGVPSTDQESLEKLAVLNHPAAPLIRNILQHRQVSKLKGTYVDALPELVHPRTGRIHASFHQTVAATGRLSSSDPNLQNVPVRRELGQQIRQAFVSEPGWLLLTADYSQIELRLLAHFCGDDRLVQAFAEERDIHATVASEIFNIPEAEVDAAQRRMAKTVNFGVIYGISPGGLSQRLHISRKEAAQFIDTYFARYPKVQQYQTQVLRDCKRMGYVKTLLGRRRHFDPKAIRSHSSYQQRNQAEREAINMEVQGSAADLIKLAMLRVYRRLKSEGFQARMLLQIHDELVFETPAAELARLSSLVREEMTLPVEQALGLCVSLRVDLASGSNWLEVD